MSGSHKITEDVLKIIHKDIINGKIYGIHGDNLEADFVKHYLDTVKNKTHPTHYKVSFHEDFYRGGSYSFVGKVRQEFVDDWMDKKSPAISLGEVNGKHSEVERTWDDFEYTNDYYEVEAVSEKLGPLDYEFEKWEKAEKEYEEACAAFIKDAVDLNRIGRIYEGALEQRIQECEDFEYPEQKYDAKERTGQFEYMLKTLKEDLELEERIEKEKVEDDKKMFAAIAEESKKKRKTTY